MPALKRRIPWKFVVLTAAATGTPVPAIAEDGASQVASAEDFREDEVETVKRPELPPPKEAQALPEPDRVWVDKKRREVLVDGYVSLREGYLEMFACTEGTKEHESVVAVRSRAWVVHAALLSVGAEPGRPVQFQPKFRPPSGDQIEIDVLWLDEAGKWQKIDAQQWVRDVRTGKPMTAPWVFAGSGFWTDESTGKRYYMAESGDFICVSNFTTATIDVPIESSDANDGLAFEANTELIPPLGAPVRLVLRPKRTEQHETQRPPERGGEE